MKKNQKLFYSSAEIKKMILKEICKTNSKKGSEGWFFMFVRELLEISKDSQGLKK